MFVWLVTVRAAEGRSLAVHALLVERLIPLLRAQPGCAGPTLAACVNCVGEYTYLAYWDSRGAVEAFEANPNYQAVVDELKSMVRRPLERELWAVLSC